jgi:glutaconate CoA-transferase subunit B
MVLASTDVLLLLQRGYIDIGFMGGAQIDQYGNLNSSFIGDPDKPTHFFREGAWGNAYVEVWEKVVGASHGGRER